MKKLGISKNQLAHQHGPDFLGHCHLGSTKVGSKIISLHGQNAGGVDMVNFPLAAGVL